MADNSEKQKKIISEVAIKLFKKDGYENVSVNDICKSAGIARSTFYMHFIGKKEIFEKILLDAKTNKDELLGEFIEAENDFERMWILCDRYLSVALNNGPKLTATLLRLDLLGEIDILGSVHEVDDWMIKLTSNCQKTGIILSTEPAEVIAPLSVDISYYTTYEWCRSNGSFNLRQAARRRAETTLNIAPDCRMRESELEKL